MGIIRKTMSLGTAGLVDFRSDKERIARSTRKTSKEAREQTKLMQQQLEMQQQAMLQQQATGATARIQTPAGRPPMTERLQQLDALLAQGVITSDEHSARRAAILAEI